MLTGPKILVGSGTVRDVWLVEYQEREVVVKTLRQMDDARHREYHTREMLTMDAVSFGARDRLVELRLRKN